jgi:hypothetical protein
MEHMEEAMAGLKSQVSRVQSDVLAAVADSVFPTLDTAWCEVFEVLQRL